MWIFPSTWWVLSICRCRFSLISGKLPLNDSFILVLFYCFWDLGSWNYSYVGSSLLSIPISFSQTFFYVFLNLLVILLVVFLPFFNEPYYILTWIYSPFGNIEIYSLFMKRFCHLNLFSKCHQLSLIFFQFLSISVLKFLNFWFPPKSLSEDIYFDVLSYM